MNDVSVLIYSCDAYADIWEIFFKLFYRYWKCPYPVYLAAETKECQESGVETINCIGDTWTDRIRQAVEKIPSEYIIGMCEDMFLRRDVRQFIIDKCVRYMNQDARIACFNFEKDYNETLACIYHNFGLKPPNGDYKKSCQPSLWRKSILLEYLSVSQDPWEWEMSGTPDTYKHYIWIGDENRLVFEYGFHDYKWFGIRKGKWVKDDVVPLFKKEGIDVDYSIRGFSEEER